MKLYKVEFFNEEAYDKSSKSTIPRIQTSNEMEEVEIQNPKEIIRYFDKYKKSITH